MSVADLRRVIVSVAERSEFPPVPADRLLRVEGTRWLSEEDFRWLATIPGVFFAFGHGPMAMPAGGNVAFSEWTSKGRWPDPLYVPMAQLAALEERLKADLRGILPRSQEPLPVAPLRGRNPRTGSPWALLPFQEEGVRRLRELRRSILRLPVGLGKTAVAIALGHDLLERGAIDRVVVAAPRRLCRQVWRSQIASLLLEEPVVVDGTPSARIPLWARAAASRWVITKYDLWLAKDGQTALRSLLGPRTLVVVDEVHHHKNPSTKRWKAFRGLLDSTRTEYRTLLTGTIVHDKPTNVFGPVELLGLHVWNTYREFEDAYFMTEDVRTGSRDAWGREVVVRTAAGLKGPSEGRALQSVIDSVSFFKTREEVADQVPMTPLLPPDYREVTATRAEEALYEEVVSGVLGEKLRAEGSERDPSILALMTMERMFSDDPMLIVRSESETAVSLRAGLSERLKEASPGSKLRSLLLLLGDFVEEETSKAVVFSQFRRALERVLEVVADPPPSLDAEEREAADALRGRLLLYHGELSDREGDAVVAAFLKDPAYRVLLSTDAGGEGMNLQSVASHVVHFDDPLSLGNAEQREGRVYGRIGQFLPFRATHLLFTPSERLYLEMERAVERGYRFVDSRVADLLAYKRAQRDLVVGGPR